MSKFLTVLFSLTLSTQPVLAGQMPDLLYIPDAGSPSIPGTRYPDWVAAERVLTPAGEIDASLLGLSSRLIIGKYLRRPADKDCIRWGPGPALESIMSGTPKDRKTLTSAVKSADWVFRAAVTGSAHGFNGSTPGTLLEIIPEETLKGPRDRAGAHYIFVPVGKFSVGGKRICKTDDRYARLPEVGEHMDAELEHEEVDSVSGLVLLLLGRPAVPGDAVEYDGFRFVVTQVAGHGVEECRVIPLPQSPPQSP